jgi:hypothetical protein
MPCPLVLNLRDMQSVCLLSLSDKITARCDPGIFGTEATPYLFSAKGATFSVSLGQLPRIRGTPKQRQR